MTWNLFRIVPERFVILVQPIPENQGSAVSGYLRFGGGWGLFTGPGHSFEHRTRQSGEFLFAQLLLFVICLSFFS